MRSFLWIKDMAAETKVQFICSENFNAPGLGNEWGALINVLDACLVSGLSLPVISSTTANGTQITLTFSTNHLLKMFQVIRLKGFQPNSLNNDFRIIGVPTASSVVIESNITAITTVGTASLKPLGYEKAFSGENKAVYRDLDTSSMHRPFLRVDNSLDPIYNTTYAKYAKVGVFESCTSIDDISGAQIPFDSTAPTKNWVGTGTGGSAYNGWAKWYYARATNAYDSSSDSGLPTNGNRQWMIVGNSQGFYLMNPVTPSDSHKLLYGFGVYDLIDGVNATPYYLLATWDYTTVAVSRDFSGSINVAPLYSKTNPAILFNGVGVNTQVSALAAHNLYESGVINTYSNNFACMPFTLVSNSYLMGVLPCLRYINKSRSDAAYSTVAYSNMMYVIDIQINNGRYAFNLGSL